LIHTKKSKASQRIRKGAKYKLREGICSNKMESLKIKGRDQQINKESLVSWYVNIAETNEGNQ
jgi:hypothetical protein